MRRANPVEFGLSPPRHWYGVNDFGWRVPLFSIAGSCVYLHQLGEIYACSKAVLNRVNVGLEAVCSDLELTLRGLIDLFRKGYGVACRPPSKMPRHDQLTIPLQSHEAVGVSPQRVAGHVVLFFAAYIAPNLVALNVFDRKLAEAIFQQPLASVASQHQEPENGVAVSTGYPLNGAHRHALDKQRDNARGPFRGQVHASYLPVVKLRERPSALAATEALIPFPVFPKFLAAGIAVMTGHWACLSAEQAR